MSKPFSSAKPWRKSNRPQQGQDKDQCPEFWLQFKVRVHRRLLSSHPCSLTCSRLLSLSDSLLESVCCWSCHWPCGFQDYKVLQIYWPVCLQGGRRSGNLFLPLGLYKVPAWVMQGTLSQPKLCLLYTSDAADDWLVV